MESVISGKLKMNSLEAKETPNRQQTLAACKKCGKERYVQTSGLKWGKYKFCKDCARSRYDLR